MQLKLLDVQRVCRGHGHNAFGDITRFKGKLLVCYRSAQSHMSEDGRVVICELDEHRRPIRFQYLSESGCDLRDPHFCLDGSRLFILAHQRVTCNSPQAFTFSWFSDNGLSWSGRHAPGPKNWWLWRVCVHNHRHWGLAYLRRADRLDLYCGHLRSSMQQVKTGVLSRQRHHLGYPNETDCFFADNGQLYALTRRDADSFTAQFGVSKPPYARWHWHDLKVYIGGPAMLPVDDRTALVAGRHNTNKGFVTRLWRLDLKTARLTTLVTLPSGGDNSYPGLVKHNGLLYVSYYSSHIDNQSRMYLAVLHITDTHQDR
ncbi:MAG: hypothetical protein SWN10_14825 [Pseudomonadota bacterium]|uniref:Exo-alpha-sialidase n=1 Tax=Alteromonas alba TaxID=2079529 RepID=A0A2S9VEA8_9ALTE|nr:hypothetical protein [Alteromonas alba]MDY6928360.1 hypothetical protein [Pseudomonadota bacterium]PRO74790.1 hypothetical protein C6Y40_04250 [Alteromonas alba]